ncbi:glycoside hydrolase family 2 protein [Aquimarina celericrescens]|uniref:beta-mannosidase n=1 Tax=Aquimarina celericrescens TaxID=1964542 RepID=A0ABW5B1U6_9FLAO|nr:hypothetical protein [Aquimarina celericrescens]
MKTITENMTRIDQFEKKTLKNNKQLTLDWKVGFAKQKEDSPKEYYNAIVPGAVQLDYARAHNWPNLFMDDNFKAYGWMEDVFWIYKTNFEIGELSEDSDLYFYAGGIDYQFDIMVNGRIIYEQEGMFTPIHIALTDHLLKENELIVRIHPAPKVKGVAVGRDEASQSAKPAVSYGWDWHPRLIPLGIWDKCYLELKNDSFIKDVYVDYTLNDDLSKVDLQIIPEIVNKNFNYTYVWRLLNKDGVSVIERETDKKEIMSFSFDQPLLWWPHDHGDPYLYTSVFQLKNQNGKVIDEKQQQVGFRKVKLVMNPGTWELERRPMSRSYPPITIKINNKEIFSKGTNWVNPEIFPGTITKKRYEDLLNRVLEGNFNMLRAWGGSIVCKEAFYEFCNKKGILVWTEFPLSCNNYVGTKTYLNVLEQEAKSIIKRIRKHPSHVLWSGGNELFNDWSRMTDQSLALRLLNKQCYDLDPKNPFIPTAPVAGMAHGNYVFKDPDTKEEVYQWIANTKATAYTEFGMPGPSDVSILKQIIPEKDLFPPKKGTSWETHHAFGAWIGDTWLQLDLLNEYFGEAKHLEELVANGQWLQCEGYKAIYEEARRQKPYCSMALNWCFNEPWPTAANNSIINYPNIPKPSFYSVADSCRPVLASARISKFCWEEDEIFEAELWILNDRYKKIDSGTVQAKLLIDSNEYELTSWKFQSIEENQNLLGPTVRFRLPKTSNNHFKLVLEVSERSEWNSSYKLKYVHKKVIEKDRSILA